MILNHEAGLEGNSHGWRERSGMDFVQNVVTYVQQNHIVIINVSIGVALAVAFGRVVVRPLFPLRFLVADQTGAL